MDREDRIAAVETAYRRHADDVYRVAYAITRRPDLAEDATQETFARVFERWESFDATRPLGPWLHTIAARVALDGLRRRRVREFLGIGGAAVRPFIREIDVAEDRSGGNDPAIEVIRRTVTEDLLRRLAPQARAALVLRHYHGYDYASIASILGTTSGNVGSLISRAHAQLRQELTPAPGSASSADKRSGDSREVLE